jgi:hypothetical protein
MRTRLHSDDGAPCWRCDGTIFTYTVDDTVTYIGATCIGCGADNMFYPPAHSDLDTAASVSAAHRKLHDGLPEHMMRSLLGDDKKEH